MHDFILAKEIIDTLDRIISKKDIKNIKKINLEIGSISKSHDGQPEHPEDISIENLRFSLESLVKTKTYKNAKFEIEKVAGSNWKISDIEVE